MNREVREFQPDQPVADPQQFAIGVRCYYGNYDYLNNRSEIIDLVDRFNDYLDGLPKMADEDQLEALVFGRSSDGQYCSGSGSSQGVVTMLVEKSDRLPKLKSVFIGEIIDEEWQISDLSQSDLSPLLNAYPNLELLQARGGNGLEFSASGDEARHDHLKALIVETGGLSRKTVQQIYRWDFPALEHLELWFGSPEYGGDCWEQDLAPLLEDLIFPNLIYLGIRNCEFIDEAIDRIVRSPLLAGLQVLDISMGTLTDDGAAKLLDCPAIQDLDILNVSESYLSGAMTAQLTSLGIEVLADYQRKSWRFRGEEYRYCVVNE